MPPSFDKTVPTPVPASAPVSSTQKIADAPAPLPEEPLSPKARRILNVWHQIGPLLLLILAMCAIRSSLADWNDVPTGSMKPSILEGDRIFVNKLAYDLKFPLYSNEGWVVAIYAAVAVLPVAIWILLPSMGIPRPRVRRPLITFGVIVLLALGYIAHWAASPDSPNWQLTRWSEPKQGEVVVFLSPDTGIRLVKRCIGVPGDTLELLDNKLLINGVACSYSPLDPKYRAQLDSKERGDYHYHAEAMPGGRVHPVLAEPFKRNDRRTYGPKTLGPGEFFMMGDNRDNSGDSRFFIKPVTRDLILGRATAVAFSLDYKNYWWPRWNRFFTKLP